LVLDAAHTAYTPPIGVGEGENECEMNGMWLRLRTRPR
jgi:hypothetical protein